MSALVDRGGAVEIRLLGPFDVVCGGSTIALGTRKQRAVLALLALEPNTTVSSTRLIDALWGDDPPPSARAVLQTYVAGLRRSLDGTGIAVETRSSGYLLDVNVADVDNERFRALIGEAHEHATRGERSAATDKLRAALGLWRGRPFEEFASEPGLADAADRLESQRVDATEERIEAELSIGASSTLVDELRSLVSEHPYRERLRGQLMRALYLTGRQGDALEAYRDARRTLADELGVEPGPELRGLERRILEHDPALTPPAFVPNGDERRFDSRRGAQRSRLMLPTAAAGAVIAAITGLLLARGGDQPLAVAPNSVAAIDPVANKVVGSIPVGIRPGPVFAAGATLWVGNLSDRTLTVIDVRARERTDTFTLNNRTPTALAVDHGIAWVVHGALGRISFVDAQFGAVWDVRDVAGRAPYAPTGAIAISGRWAWAVFGDSTLARLRNPSGASPRIRVETTFAGNSPVGVVVAYQSLWVANAGDATVQRFNPDTFDEGPIQSYTVRRRPGGIAAGAEAVWVTSTGDDVVTRIDPTSDRTLDIDVEDAPTAVVVAEGAVWVVNTGDASVSRIDPKTLDVVETIELGNPPAGIAFAGGLLWVTVQAR